MLALVGYPFLFEPWTPTRSQRSARRSPRALRRSLPAPAGRACNAGRPAVAPSRSAEVPGRSPDDAPPAAGRQLLWCVWRRPDRCCCRGIHARHAEHRRRAAAVDRAARDLSPHFHPLLRRHRVVPARDLLAMLAAVCVMAWTLADRSSTHELPFGSSLLRRLFRNASSAMANSSVRSRCPDPDPSYLIDLPGRALGSGLVGIVAPLVLPHIFELAGGSSSSRCCCSRRCGRDTSYSVRSRRSRPDDRRLRRLERSARPTTTPS